jgi:hypothetical protein
VAEVAGVADRNGPGGFGKRLEREVIDGAEGTDVPLIRDGQADGNAVNVDRMIEENGVNGHGA